MTPVPPRPRTLGALFPRYSGERIDLGALGPPPTTMEMAGALAPMAGAAVFAPSLPLALASVPLTHAYQSGAFERLPSIPTMPGEPWTTLAELFTGFGGGEGQAGSRVWRPGMKLKDIREAGIEVPYQGKKLLVPDVANYLNKQVETTMGAVPRDAPPKLTIRRMMNLGRKELEDQLTQPETGLGWYDEDVTQASRDLGRVFPEIQPGSPSDVLWTAVSSVLSPSSNPKAEAYNAARVYDEYRNTGRIPVRQPSGKNWPSQGASKALTKVQNMIDVLGEQGFIDFLTSKQTVRDIRQFRPSTAGKQDDVTLGALALGPKVGRYFANRLGIGTGTTVDLWDTRKAGRQLGQLIDAQGRIIEAPRTEGERNLYMDVHGRLGEEFGIQPKDAQSAQWHYEQALYRLLGLPVKSLKLSEGTARYLQSRGVEP
jgi:hypothetical protein